MYLSIFDEYDKEIDVYADLIIKYVSTLIELAKLEPRYTLAKKEMKNKIYLRSSPIKKVIASGIKTYTYKYPYFKNTDTTYMRMTNKQYIARKDVWEQALSIWLYHNELETIIENIEKCIKVHVHTPQSQPSLEQIKQLTQQQIKIMQLLQEKHTKDQRTDNSPYGHNCVHEDGTRFASRAELLVYECIRKCGLQVIYEYKYLNEKCHVLTKPDFYGYRYDNPFIIEFFGMMNIKEYREKALKKVTDYKECGFELGKNFIALCSEKNGDINMKTIHTVLKKFCVYGSLPKNLIYIDCLDQAM